MATPPKRGDPAASPDFVAALAKAITTASADGGAQQRLSFEVLFKQQSDALGQAYAQIEVLKKDNREHLDTIQKIIGTNSQLATLEHEAKIKLKEIEAESSFKSQMIDLGIAIAPDFVRRWTGAIPSLTKGDGTKTGERKAAMFRIVDKILKNPPIHQQLVALVGEEDWGHLRDFLMDQIDSPPGPTNGAPAGAKVN